MLLAIDIGNTNIVVGAYVGEPARAAGAESGQADDDAPFNELAAADEAGLGTGGIPADI